MAIGNTAGEIAFIDLATHTSTIKRLDFVEGTLRLKAQYDEENAMDIAIPFDSDTEYLISQ